MTPRHRARRRPWTTSVAGATLGAVVVGLSVTTTYAVAPASASSPSQAVAGARPQAMPQTRPHTRPTVVPQAAPTCAPWQTRTTVPPGVVLKPRVFPGDERATAAPTPKPAPGSAPKATGTPQPAKPRVVCRNAAPTPFPHAAWEPESVVGGSRLAGTGVLVDRPASVVAPPAVYDVSYVLADLDSGDILAAKSPHAWLRPASTLKTLTALTLLPMLDPGRVVVASQAASSAAGTRVGILAGNRYPVRSLVDAMLMFSANDAVYALADAAGGYERTVQLMNAKATEIGAHDTVTVDPSGLDEGGQRSSAYDLALMGRDAMRLPAFRAAIAKRDSVFPGGKDRYGKVWPAFHVYNINDLLKHYPGAIGIKPGRTDRAQHTFIGAATRGGRTLVVAQMGSITGSWKPTAALLDWGFANADQVTPVGRLVEPGEAAAPRPAATVPALPTDGSEGAGSATPGSPDGDPGDQGAEAAPRTRETAYDRTLSLVVVGAAGLVVSGAAAVLTVALRRRRSSRAG